MKKIKNWLILVLVVLIIPTFLSLFNRGYFTMHDDLQISRLYEMDLCFHDGQVPCRWVPDMGYGYGYPLFNFYPPFPYYLAEAVHLLGFSYIVSIKFLFFLGLALCGFFAFLLGRELWGNWGGLISGVFYAYAPYHAVDVYVRGAMNEFWGLVFFPAVFWAVLLIIKKESRQAVFALALFYGLLLLSHSLMAFFFGIPTAAWTIFLILYFKKPFREMWKVIFGGLWGLGLAAFFTLPAMFEQKFVHIETMFIGYFNYLAHFADFRQLFLNRFWGYGASVWGPEDGMPFPVGQVHWIVGLITFLIFFFLWLKKRKKEFFLIIFLFIFFLGTAFLAHPRATGIWQKIAILGYMQFPWRFLAMTSFFVSMISGGLFLLIKRNVFRWLLLVGLCSTAIGFNFRFFKPEKILLINDTEKLFSAKGWNKLQTDAIFDYLPIYAAQPPGGPAPDKPWFEEGKGEISDFKKGTDWMTFTVKVASDNAKIRLPLYYFPGWEINVDGKRAEIDHKNELGLATISVSPGEHIVSARLTNTLIRSLGNLLSLASWALLVWFIVRQPKAFKSQKSNKKS